MFWIFRYIGMIFGRICWTWRDFVCYRSLSSSFVKSSCFFARSPFAALCRNADMLAFEVDFGCEYPCFCFLAFQLTKLKLKCSLRTKFSLRFALFHVKHWSLYRWEYNYNGTFALFALTLALEFWFGVWFHASATFWVFAWFALGFDFDEDLVHFRMAFCAKLWWGLLLGLVFTYTVTEHTLFVRPAKNLRLLVAKRIHSWVRVLLWQFPFVFLFCFTWNNVKIEWKNVDLLKTSKYDPGFSLKLTLICGKDVDYVLCVRWISWLFLGVALYKLVSGAI